MSRLCKLYYVIRTEGWRYYIRCKLLSNTYMFAVHTLCFFFINKYVHCTCTKYIELIIFFIKKPIFLILLECRIFDRILTWQLLHINFALHTKVQLSVSLWCLTAGMLIMKIIFSIKKTQQVRIVKTCLCTYTGN